MISSNIQIFILAFSFSVLVFCILSETLIFFGGQPVVRIVESFSAGSARKNLGVRFGGVWVTSSGRRRGGQASQSVGLRVFGFEIGLNFCTLSSF